MPCFPVLAVCLSAAACALADWMTLDASSTWPSKGPLPAGGLAGSWAGGSMAVTPAVTAVQNGVVGTGGNPVSKHQ